MLSLAPRDCSPGAREAGVERETASKVGRQQQQQQPSWRSCICCCTGRRTVWQESKNASQIKRRKKEESGDADEEGKAVAVAESKKLTKILYDSRNDDAFPRYCGCCCFAGMICSPSPYLSLSLPCSRLQAYRPAQERQLIGREREEREIRGSES